MTTINFTMERFQALVREVMRLINTVKLEKDHPLANSLNNIL